MISSLIYTKQMRYQFYMNTLSNFSTIFNSINYF